MRAALLVLALGGCKPTLKGWWDLDRWEVTGGEGTKPLVATDAGVVCWQADGNNAGYGTVYLVLRYDYDPVAFDLVPDPDPEQSSQSWSFDDWDKDQPIVFSWPEGTDGEYLSATFELLEYDPNAMTLEGPSPMGDAATWTWSLVR